MCRIFAFRSRVDLKVQRSLVKAENALQLQSQRHPHGWGIAWYAPDARVPTVHKSMAPAWEDDGFERVSSFLVSHAVLAHVRKATVGELRAENTHPFAWGPWTFCHNGTIFGFAQLRDRLRARIHPRFLPAIAGTTDSETLFYLVLSALERAGYDVHAPGGPLPAGLWDELGGLLGWIRDLATATRADPRESMMNFVLTDGLVLLAARFNGGLSFSTQKRRCADFDVCPVPSKVCFGIRREGVNHTHLLVASDPTSPDDVWEEIPNRGLLAVEADLRIAVRPLPGLQGGPAWYA